MKKLLALILLATLLLTACTSAPSGVYESDGLRMTVDWELCQIADGQQVYDYSLEQTGNEEKVIFTYPNGARYFVVAVDGVVLAEGSVQSADISGYISPKLLYAAIDDQRPLVTKVFQGFDGYDIIMFIFAAFFIMVGIFNVTAPESAWGMRMDWQVEDGSPTDRALRVTIFRGVVTIIMGILLIAYVILLAFK